MESSKFPLVGGAELAKAFKDKFPEYLAKSVEYLCDVQGIDHDPEVLTKIRKRAQELCEDQSSRIDWDMEVMRVQSQVHKYPRSEEHYVAYLAEVQAVQILRAASVRGFLRVSDYDLGLYDFPHAGPLLCPH